MGSSHRKSNASLPRQSKYLHSSIMVAAPGLFLIWETPPPGPDPSCLGGVSVRSAGNFWEMPLEGLILGEVPPKSPAPSPPPSLGKKPAELPIKPPDSRVPRSLILWPEYEALHKKTRRVVSPNLLDTTALWYQHYFGPMLFSCRSELSPDQNPLTAREDHREKNWFFP